MPKLLARLAGRPTCPDLEPDCFRLAFCDAWRCAVLMRRGLTGDVAHCPVAGVACTVQYPSGHASRPAA